MLTFQSKWRLIMELISGNRKRDGKFHQFLGHLSHSPERLTVFRAELFEELKTQTMLNKETRRKSVTAAHASGLSQDPGCTQPYSLNATPRSAVLWKCSCVSFLSYKLSGIESTTPILFVAPEKGFLSLIWAQRILLQKWNWETFFSFLIDKSHWESVVKHPECCLADQDWSYSY